MGWRVEGRGCYTRVKKTWWVRCHTITSPWFVSFTWMFLWCSQAHPGLRFLLKASTSTSLWPQDSCQQLVEHTVIHQTQSLSGVTPNRKLYIGNLSWPIHLHSWEGNQSEVKTPLSPGIRLLLLLQPSRWVDSSIHLLTENESTLFLIIDLSFQCFTGKTLAFHFHKCKDMLLVPFLNWTSLDFALFSTRVKLFTIISILFKNLIDSSEDKMKCCTNVTKCQFRFARFCQICVQKSVTFQNMLNLNWEQAVFTSHIWIWKKLFCQGF